ncbi:hypothetical protein HCK01_16395, partial [Streptomyces sp. AA8]|uniref:hypothetical protein n=1 Tax=Streptomyces telluris TaxID=2720021 RepID=UPI00143C111A
LHLGDVVAEAEQDLVGLRVQLLDRGLGRAGTGCPGLARAAGAQGSCLGGDGGDRTRFTLQETNR